MGFAGTRPADASDEFGTPCRVADAVDSAGHAAGLRVRRLHLQDPMGHLRSDDTSGIHVSREMFFT